MDNSTIISGITFEIQDGCLRIGYDPNSIEYFEFNKGETKDVADFFANGWISVDDKLPELHQRVLFVVKSDNEWYNGKVYGGSFTGNDFVTPGIAFGASHWMPSPEPPTV